MNFVNFMQADSLNFVTGNHSACIAIHVHISMNLRIVTLKHKFGLKKTDFCLQGGPIYQFSYVQLHT